MAKPRSHPRQPRLRLLSIVFVLPLFLGAAASTRATAATASSGPVLAYSFDEGSGLTATDSSGNGNNGTLTGASWQSAGKHGGALSFSGSSSYVTAGDAPSLDLSSAMTLEAWVYPTADSGDEPVVAKERGGGGFPYGIELLNGVPSVYVNSGTRTVATGTAALPLSTWSYVAATYDGSTLRLYVDGTQVASAAASGTLVATADPLRVGGDLTWSEFLHGRIDDVRVYARALAATEIQTDMATAVAAPRPPAPVAAYAFNETSGATAVDASGTGNNGSVTAGTWDPAGKNGGALDFDGTSTLVSVPDASTLDLTGPLTLEAWVYPTAAPASATLIAKERSGGGFPYGLELGSGVPAAYVNNGSHIAAAAASPLPLFAWTHLAATYDGSAVRLYVNGTQAASTAASGALTTSNDPLRIGGDLSWGEYFNGRIDDVRVYPRALGAAQIQTDMSTAVAPAPAADTQPPTTPTGFGATGATQTSISTSWNGSTDNVGVAGYHLYRGGVSVATTTSTSYTFTGLACGTSYTLAVDAYDAAGNVSSRATVSASTSACSPAPTPSSPCGVSTAPPATFHHVIWIWMENHAYNEIIGGSSAPYINQLASSCGLATNYTAVTHPSLPNYIAATSGSTQGITDDNSPSSHPLSVNSIFQQASSSGSYEESMPSNCDLTDAYPYAVKHNPQAYYTNIRTACGTTNVALGSTSSGNLLNALNSNTLPAFTFITPNLCNDMHDCSVSTGDSWLQSWVPKLISSPGYQEGSTAIFITWDEDDSSSSNHIATIVVSPYTPAGKKSATAYNHYSLLKTTEQMLGISTYLGNAATASSMLGDFFGGAAPAPAPSLPTGPLVPAKGALFGAWVNDTTTTWTQADVSNFESMIGRKLKIDMRYYNWSTNLPTADESWDLQNGRIPMITWEPWGTTLDGINAGGYDGYIRGVASGLKNLGQPVFLRPMQEMNGDWYPWDGYHNNSTGATDGPSKFVQAWRHLHDIFTSVGATNVVWVWSPNWESVPKDAWNAIPNYYPGDAYVDWVGIDGYNWGTTQSWGSTWMAYAAIESPIYNLYASVKPVMTSETASCEQGGDKAQWITDARNAIESQFPDIRAFIWFDMNKECDWRVNSSTTALAAYRAMAGDAYFNP